MVKKIFIIPFLFASIILFNTLYVFACSPDTTPRFYLETHECSFFSHNENLSSNVDILEFINNRTIGRSKNCNKLVLSETDQQIFRNVINQFNKNDYFFSSVIIEKQSYTEYEIFLKKAKKINDDKCDCQRYDNITRLNDWTIYVKSRDCATDPVCQAIPPEGCFNRYTYNLSYRYPFFSLILFFVFPTTLIVIVIFSVIFLVKRKK